MYLQIWNFKKIVAIRETPKLYSCTFLLLSVGMDNFEALLSGAHFMVSERHFSIIIYLLH